MPRTRRQNRTRATAARRDVQARKGAGSVRQRRRRYHL